MNLITVLVKTYTGDGQRCGTLSVSTSISHRNTVHLAYAIDGQEILIGEVLAHDLEHAVTAVDDHSGYVDEPRGHGED